MKSILMRTSLIFFLIVLFIPNVTSAELKTFIKEYRYQAGEYDSKVTCRTLALEQVKRLLLEELGTYLESETIVQNYQLSKDQITVITAGIVKTNIIDEKWDGNSYWVKVEISSDPQELSKSIDRILGNAQLLINLKIAKKKADDALNELEKLKKRKSKGSNKLATKNKYKKEINVLSNSDEWLKDFKLLLEAGGDIDKGKYDSAILTAETIINKKGVDSGNLAQAYLTIGFAYKQKGMFIEAIEALQKVSTIKSGHFETASHKYLGQTYYEMKMYQKAISEFEKSISILNKLNKIVIKQKRSDYDRILGLGSFQRSMDDYDVSLADNLLWLAIAYWGRDLPPGTADDDYIKIPKETISAVKNILKIKPNSPSILEKVFFLTSKKDQSDIRDWCEKLIKRYPNNNKVYFVRGRTYMILEENYQQSIRDFSKAIELDPQNPEPHKFRGLVFSIIGNYEMAIKDYDRAIAMNPSEAALYNLRGRASLAKITIMKDGKPHTYGKDEEQAEQFVSGKIRIGELSLYKCIEDVRQDPLEGTASFTWDMHAPELRIDSMTGKPVKGGLSSTEKIQYKGMICYPLYLLCTTSVRVNKVAFANKNRYSCYVEINDSLNLLILLDESWAKKNYSFGNVELKKVTYDRDILIKKSNKYLLAPRDIAYTQKSLIDKDDCEYRFVFLCKSNANLNLDNIQYLDIDLYNGVINKNIQVISTNKSKENKG